MQQITTDLLATIYNRAIEVAIAKYNQGEPNIVEIYYDGSLRVTWFADRKEWEDEYEFLSAEDLTADLDELAKQREVRKEEERKARKLKEQQDAIIRERQEKEKRHQTYLLLKKEFE